MSKWIHSALGTKIIQSVNVQTANLRKGLGAIVEAVSAAPKHFWKACAVASLSVFVMASVGTYKALAPDSKDIERSTELEQQYTAIKNKINSSGTGLKH